VLARLHIVVRLPKGAPIPDVDVGELDQRLASATRTWAEDFSEALSEQLGEERAAALRAKYANSFPAAYREDFPPRTAVADLRRLEELEPDGDFALSLYEPLDAGPGERRFKIFRTGSAISLSTVLPKLARMGVEVIDERPYEIVGPPGSERPLGWIYDFGLHYDPENSVEFHLVRELFEEAFA